MKFFNITLKRKNIIFSLFCLLALTCVYLYFYSAENNQGLIEVVKEEEQADPAVMSEDTEKTDTEDFFDQYRVEREKTRSVEIETIQKEIINNKNASEESKQKGEEKILAINDLTEHEMVLENLIKTKGFEDALVFFHEEGVNVVIKAKELKEEDVAKVADVVSRGSNIAVDDIVVSVNSDSIIAK